MLHPLYLALLLNVLPIFASQNWQDVRGDLHFPLHARASNLDGSKPIYKDANAGIEARVNDLLPRMSLEEKVAQLYVYHNRHRHYNSSTFRIQGDMNGWMNFNNPLDDTKSFNQTGLVRFSMNNAELHAHY